MVEIGDIVSVDSDEKFICFVIGTYHSTNSLLDDILRIRWLRGPWAGSYGLISPGRCRIMIKRYHVVAGMTVEEIDQALAQSQVLAEDLIVGET